MKLETKNINSTISKAYLSQSTFIEEINIFKGNYFTLIKNIKPTDSEETLKDYINDFLKNTYYKNKYAIKENINNIDIAIYNGKNEEDKIGIIIETKAIKNIAEMITETEINKKALHEIILYYLEERITNSNIEIKHLIITNSIDWFIFDATEFERLFVETRQDISLRKKYNDWNNKQLVSKNKDWFYTEIAKPFIENYDETIICTHLTLPAFETLEELGDQQWIELYKIFSPEHLLKLPFANDSNTLNQEFYNELLHIIGLYETKDNSRKIERLTPNLRNEGSLLENVIFIIETDDILERLKNLQDFENLVDFGSKDEQIFSIALELCITWVNRIIFLKLLESQLLTYNNKNKDFVFLTSEKIKDFETLKELFFEVLSVKSNYRKNNLKEKYKNIPYLNSSLFEPTTLEKEAVKINHLKQHTELQIYNSTVLKDQNGKQKNGNLFVLKYLLDFLDSYNFASDKKIEIQENNKTLINSSVLGLIFEKLNGYKEGSFFTPGYVTMYICRENIRNTVIQKFNSAFDWKCKTIIHVYNQISKDKIEDKKANEIFNSIKICDPAVGSGHFLVSALNELIVIKSELGILTDKEGKLFRRTKFEVGNDELYVTYNDKLFYYDLHDAESQRLQETIFNEKRTLIENCLFGVDINPKSVQICRLRLWIELLKNAYYKVPTTLPKFETLAKLNLELETLPNIDINIKHGNSLVSFFELNGNSFKNGQLSKIQKFTKEYKIQTELYKNALNKKEKEVIVKHLENLKNNFTDYANPHDKDYQKQKELQAQIDERPIFFSKDEKIQWDMKQQRLAKEFLEVEKRNNEKLKTLYKNSFEWRFEFPEVLDDNGNFTGFDAIIGNPPYISIEDLEKKHLNYYKEFYKYFYHRYDIFACFIERSLSLIKENGYLSFIQPSVFLNSKSFYKIREFLVKENTILNIDLLKDGVFEKATVPTMIIGLQKTKSIDNQIKISKDIFQTFNHINQNYYLKTENFIFNLELSEKVNKFIANVTEKTITLGEIARVSNAINTGKLSQYIVKGNTISDKKYIKVLKGGSIKRWNFIFENYFLEDKFDDFVSLGDVKVLSEPKIMMKRIGKKFEACFDDSGIAALHTVHTIRVTNKNFDLKYILALLNSKLINYIYKLRVPVKGDVFPEFRVFDLNKQIPIKIISIEKQQPFIDKVNKILELKNKNSLQDISEIEKEIDKLVYKLYNITKEEIDIIEK